MLMLQSKERGSRANGGVLLDDLVCKEQFLFLREEVRAKDFNSQSRIISGGLSKSEKS